MEKCGISSTNTSDLTKHRKVIPVESSSKKYPILTKFTLNIKNDENIYYQGNQEMEVVLLYHKNIKKNKGIIKIDSSSVNDTMQVEILYGKYLYLGTARENFTISL